MRALALREARHEYAEYYFLFPLFLSITLLTQAGFFDQMAGADSRRGGHARTRAGGVGAVLRARRSCRPFSTTTSSPISRRARWEASTSQMLHLFAMAQIAGYALGGCWTHIGSAQSVVAYSFIQRDVDAGFTPVQWIRQMTPIILEMFALITIVIFIESRLLQVSLE